MELAIDADGHVHEEDAMFTEYLEPEFRAATKGWRLNDDNNRRFIVNGEEHPPFPKEISVRKPMSADNRIKVLDKEKISLAVLYPSAALTAGYMEPKFSQAIMRAYNNWMANWCSACPDRLKFAAPIILYDTKEAIHEASRAVGDLGAVAITVRPNPSEGKRLDHPDREPFYAAVEELGVPLVVHESTGDPSTAGGERYGGMMVPESYLYHHMISHPFEQMMAMMALICSGILERHPKLKVGFFEAGCSWVPYWIARLDDHFEHPKLGHYMAGAKHLPSEYFERQCVVTCDPGDPTIPLAVQALGAHKVLFATDYPHFDSGGGAVQSFLDVADVSPDDQTRILRDNTKAFYSL
ncbi:MAG: amidohydrolase family protein [Pseudomonadota bacterium]|nr:amidohydrolase family protein [Pseudomonadota bacterium]